MKYLIQTLVAAALAAIVSASALAQMPVQDGATHAPDAWLMWREGRPWFYGIKTSPQKTDVHRRSPSDAEQPIVDRVKQLMDTRPAKAFALLDGNTVVHQEFNSPANRWSIFFGFSVGKTATAMGVGQAICAGKLQLTTKAKELLPQLAGKALGEAAVHDLLLMSSGTWRGNPDTTVWSPEQSAAWQRGELDLTELIADDRVTRAQRWGQRELIPGQVFHYKSTDPQLLAMMTAKATGVAWPLWMQQMVFNPMGIANWGMYEQDRLQNGEAAAGVRIRMEDWIRFAAWVKRSSAEPGCFGQFVREAFATQIKTEGRTSRSFAGYGYLTWTANQFAPDTAWALGWGGQLIGWSTDPSNQRMVIVFSNSESWMPDVFEVARDWMRLK
jgi:CubicO group peptidase (beta-lactamase class C family)